LNDDHRIPVEFKHHPDQLLPFIVHRVVMSVSLPDIIIPLD